MCSALTEQHLKATLKHVTHFVQQSMDLLCYDICWNLACQYRLCERGCYPAVEMHLTVLISDAARAGDGITFRQTDRHLQHQKKTHTHMDSLI